MKGRPLRVQIMISLETETVLRIEKTLEEVLEETRSIYPRQKLTRSQMIESLLRNALDLRDRYKASFEHVPAALSETDDAQ